MKEIETVLHRVFVLIKSANSCVLVSIVKVSCLQINLFQSHE